MMMVIHKQQDLVQNLIDIHWPVCEERFYRNEEAEEDEDEEVQVQQKIEIELPMLQMTATVDHDS